MKDARIVIVGGGVAGVAAASHLLVSGFRNITLLEAENRLGGRVNTVPFGEAFVDLGAHWVHGEVGNKVYEMASALDLLESSKDIENVYYALSDGTTLPPDIGARLFERCGMILNDNDALKESTASVAQYIYDRFTEVSEDTGLEKEVTDAFLEWMLKFECSIEGCDTLWDAAAAGLPDYRQCQGDPTLCWKRGGYGSVLQLLMGGGIGAEWVERDLMKGTQFNKEVVQIEWDDKSVDGVRITCLDGSSFQADYVIITVSLGVLKETAPSIFVPQLPEPNYRAIQGLGIGTVNKIYLYYDKQWWPEGSSGFSLLYRNPSLDNLAEPEWANNIIGFYTEKNAPNVLSGWLVGESARDMERTSEENVKEICTVVLKKFLGHLYTIPEPTSLIRSSWFQNHHFRGSYSYRSMKTLELKTCAADLARPVTNSKGNQVIFFAGEATHDHFYSTVHGAVETGRREAERIIALEVNLGMRKEVVIIGAGIAGLTAARILLEAGITNITILEAQSMVGGRVRSVAIEGGHVDLGAQWLHGSHSTLHDIAKEADILTNTFSVEGAGPYYRENGEEIEPKVVQEVAEEVEKILDRLKIVEGEMPESVGHYLSQEFNSYLDKCADPPTLRQIKRELYNWHVRFHIIDNSCDDLKNLSTQSWADFDFCGGTDYVNFKSGCSSLVELLAQDLPPTALRLDCPVSQVSWCEEIEDISDAPCTIVCQDGSEYQTNHVIVTPSVGFLKNNPNFFKPPIPQDHQRGLNCIGFDVINKVFLIYDKPWWNKDMKGIQLAWSHLDDGEHFDAEDGWTRWLTGFDTMVSLPNVLVGWVGGRGAKAVEDISPSDIGQHCTVLLQRFTSRTDIPQPSRVIRSQWGKNVFILGSYSHLLKEADVQGLDVSDVLVKPIFTKLVKLGVQHPTIMFAGEALHKSHYSTIHGANESGKDQAKVLLQYLGKSV